MIPRRSLHPGWKVGKRNAWRMSPVGIDMAGLPNQSRALKRVRGGIIEIPTFAQVNPTWINWDAPHSLGSLKRRTTEKAL